MQDGILFGLGIDENDYDNDDDFADDNDDDDDWGIPPPHFVQFANGDFGIENGLEPYWYFPEV